MRESAKALNKGLDMLETLASERRELTLTEMGRAAGFAKSIAHRLAQVLVARGYLERDGTRGAYRLGLKVWELGYQAVGRRRLLDVARPFLETLARDTEEHVNLAVLDGRDAVFIDIIESFKPIRTYTELGGRVPGYCSAAGKAILAFEPAAAIEALLVGPLEAFTTQTIVQPARLRKEMRLVARRGWAINREEWREDVCGLGVPVRNHTGGVVASVSVTTPASRFDEKMLRPKLLAAARGISGALGWVDAHPPRIVGTGGNRLSGRAASGRRERRTR
jgi:IclR family transcriptional regulator, KDG regulon repressor